MIQFISLIFSSLIFIIGHVFFGYIIIRLFQIVALNTQILILVLFFLLSLSALISFYLSYRWDNLATRIFYIFSAIWVGVLINAGLIVAFLLIAKLIAWLFSVVISILLIKLIFFIGTLTLSIIGLYRALSVKVTEYEVQIKNLPAAWENQVIVQLSDIHLGPVYQKRFFSALLEKVNKLRPTAVFITGDLFDGGEAGFSWLNHPFTKLQAPQGIYYGFGNHDLYLGFSRVTALLKDNPIQVLDNQMLVVNGLQIVGINYSFSSAVDLEKKILQQVNYDRQQPSILLLHAPRNIEAVQKAGIDLQLSGHTHNGQMWPFNYLAKWIHWGYAYGLFKIGDFSLIVNGGAGTWGPPFRTTSRSEIVKIILKKK